VSINWLSLTPETCILAVASFGRGTVRTLTLSPSQDYSLVLFLVD